MAWFGIVLIVFQSDGGCLINSDKGKAKTGRFTVKPTFKQIEWVNDLSNLTKKKGSSY